MRAVVQRVSRAEVAVAGSRVAAIDRGLLILLGIEQGDTQADLEWLVGKVARLRIFPDDTGRMNLDLAAIGGEALVVSQFTLLAATAKGNRPAFVRSAAPDYARPLVESFIATLTTLVGRSVPSGIFGADMQVSLVNDGPVTLVIDSRLRE